MAKGKTILIKRRRVEDLDESFDSFSVGSSKFVRSKYTGHVREVGAFGDLLEVKDDTMAYISKKKLNFFLSQQG